MCGLVSYQWNCDHCKTHKAARLFIRLTIFEILSHIFCFREAISFINKFLWYSCKYWISKRKLFEFGYLQLMSTTSFYAINMSPYWWLGLNKHQRIPKGQSKMENPEKLATLCKKWQTVVKNIVDVYHWLLYTFFECFG